MATGDEYFGRANFDYWIEGPLQITLGPGTYWLTLRNHLGGGSGSNYWMTSDGGTDGPSSSTGYFSLDAGGTWSEEGAGWHHAFEIEADSSGECADLLRGDCIAQRGDFHAGVDCADEPCRLCDDCEDNHVDACGGSDTCFDCVTQTGACACVENAACDERTACPNGQSDCPTGQFCCTNSCCGEPLCWDPCADGPPLPIPPGSGPTGMDGDN